MDKKSEEELERIANQITMEMIRNVNALKAPPSEPRPDPANGSVAEADESGETEER